MQYTSRRFVLFLLRQEVKGTFLFDIFSIHWNDKLADIKTMIVGSSLCDVKPHLCLAAVSNDTYSSFPASVERLIWMSDILTQLLVLVHSFAASDLWAAVCLTGSGQLSGAPGRTGAVLWLHHFHLWHQTGIFTAAIARGFHTYSCWCGNGLDCFCRTRTTTP